jgi:hypothetical protein
MSNIDRFNDYFSNKSNQSKSQNLNENNTIQSNVQTSYDYEWVDINTAWEYREFDRSKESENRADSNHVIEELTHKLQDGFREPLIMQYSHKYKTAYLIEGNHRLLVARRLGYKYVPIRVTIDGLERKDTKKVVGYYAPINDIVEPSLPSEIGIPNCFDKNFKPVKSEEDSFQEELVIDFEKLPDVKRYTSDSRISKTDIIEFKPLGNFWDVGFLFDSEDFEYIDDVCDNNNTLYEQHGRSLFDNLELVNANDYFTDEMKKKIDVIYPEQKFPEDFDDIYEEYFNEDFHESGAYELYLKEIARLLWDKMREDALTVIRSGWFNSETFGGTVKWLNSNLTQQFDIEKDTYKKILTNTYYFRYEGVIFEDEHIKDYELSGNEKTYEEILRYNYTNQTKIDMDFNEVNDYMVDLSELNIDNIFK